MDFYGDPIAYQAEDIELMHTRMMFPGRSLLTHKTGLGKTFIALAGAAHRGDRRILVVGTTKSLAVWVKEVPRWTGITPILITKDTKDREALWKDVCGRPEVFVLINYELLPRLLGAVPGRQTIIRRSMLTWDLLVLDEAHKKMRSHKTKTRDLMCCVPNKHINVLSATLASRGPQDLWAALNLIAPKFFTSYWRFVATHCHVFPGAFGQEIGGVKDAKVTKALLQKFAISRGNEVRTQMPPIRQTIELEMDPDQAKAYYTFLDEMILLFEDGGLAIASNKLAQGNKLRQLALCPRILNPSLPLGTGIDYILEELEEEPHTVVFAPQKAMLEEMRKGILSLNSQRADGHHYQVFVLQGGMTPEEVNKTIASWKACRGVMLCTIASAESFALDTVNVAYFLGAEYDPTLNIQAEGRLQRIDSEDLGITIRYIVILGTIEEEVKNIINEKVSNVSKIMDTYIQKVKTERIKK